MENLNLFNLQEEESRESENFKDDEFDYDSYSRETSSNDNDSTEGTEENYTNDEENTNDYSSNKPMTQEEFVNKWKKIKRNNEEIFDDFNALQKDKNLKIYASKNSALNKTLRAVGMSLVGLSSIIGYAFKLFNFLIPGADVLTGILAKPLAPIRVGGQALINANSKLKVPGRVAPSTRRRT